MDMDRSNYMLGSSRKFGKLKRCKTIGGEDQDRISGLPDVILSHILNSLTLKEAAATSILSKRWKNLWTWSPNLDFTSLKANHVNKILEQHNMPKLHKLKIWLHTRHDVDDWISIALRKAVSEIELHMCNLRADGTLLNGGEGNGIPFESLTHLYLVHVDFPDQVFDLILSKCSSLENFHLKVNNGLVNAISSTTRPLKLKSLELYLCKHLEYVQLSAPNLMTFIYQGRHRALCIKDANHLASLSLLVGYDPYPDTIYPRGKSFLFSQFSSYLPKLESLVISANLFEGMIDFTELNVFSNLKQLKLKASCTTGLPLCYKVAASIIRVAPYLELFEIFLLSISHRSYDSSEALELTSMPANQNFKEVKLYGFRGDKYTMKFLAYLVEHAISLQKIDINARGATLSGGKLKSLDFRLDWNKVDAEHSKNCVLQLRQSLSHSNVQLLFHDG